MRGDDPAVLEDLHRSGAATDLDPLADMTERHTVLPPLEGYQRVKANTAQDDGIERLRNVSGNGVSLSRSAAKGAVRYQVARMSSGRIDGRSAKIPKASLRTHDDLSRYTWRSTRPRRGRRGRSLHRARLASGAAA